MANQSSQDTSHKDQADGKFDENIVNPDKQVRESEDASLQDDSYSFDEDNTDNDEFHDMDDDNAEDLTDLFESDNDSQ